MSKITAEHLGRSAIVYVRQSISRASDVNTHWSSAGGCLVGATFK